MDPALWELLRAEAGTDGGRELEAVVRLAAPGLDVPGARMVARFGTVATCRVLARDVIAVRARPEVISVKAARGMSPSGEPALDPGAGPDPGAGAEPGPPGPGGSGPGPSDPAATELRPGDVRRPSGLALTGAGVVVGAVDWGLDFDAAAFRWPAVGGVAGGAGAGATRLLALWDQRDQAQGPRPPRYGYGTVHSQAEIDRALQDPEPYRRLGYHPAIADRHGRGSHGTRTMDIAAGRGQDGRRPDGVAPGAHLCFVHMADGGSQQLTAFGDSVRLLEAVDWISRTAGDRPCAINISAGRICGPKDGTTLVERAFDELLASTPGRFICNSAGNYRRWRAHSSGTLPAGETRSLTLICDPADRTLNELEIWYDGADEFTIAIAPPDYPASPPVRLGERADLRAGRQVVGRIYHRRRDPNNGDNHIVAYLDPAAGAGEWEVILEGIRGRRGIYHAWIERDDSCPHCQARFRPAESSTAITIGSIASSRLPLIVGAYDGHHPDRPPAGFSSAGPCRDGRDKPDLGAPGQGVISSQSAPAGARHSTGRLVRGNGTSFATPHVTGAVALCFEAAGCRLSAAQIRSLVLGSCDPARAAAASPDRLGHGYLNVGRLAVVVQQALAAGPAAQPALSPAITPIAQESVMATEDTMVLLTAAPAAAYREYLYRPHGELARWISDRFEAVARPGERTGDRLREGDVLLEVTLGRLGPGQCRSLTGPDRERLASRRLAPGQLLLRPRPVLELTGPLPTDPADADTASWPDVLTAPARTAAELAELAELDYGEYDPAARTAVPVDAAAAVPPFGPAERTMVTGPLLTARASATAAAWNDAMHPASSGVTLAEIQAALRNYADTAAVQAAIERQNAGHPGEPALPADAGTVLAQCVHQFQRKCYCDRQEHDGRAGETVLDSLGLIQRAGPGFHGGLRHNARAQQRLTQQDAAVQSVTEHGFSAATWFSGIMDPSVLGLRTKGQHGLHVLLVRRLRQAERYLLSLPEFRGMTLAQLGAALGLAEQHGGMRSAQTGSMHTFGLAVDVGYLANPWLRRPRTWQVMKRAAELVSGHSLPGKSAPEYFHSVGSDPARSTGQVWDELQQRHTEMVAYFRLGQDAAGLRATVAAGAQKGTPGLVRPGEPDAVARWQAQIQDDHAALARTDADFAGRDPGHGFLSHRKDLVIALRDHGCLSWGAVDQGPGASGSGDVMHFDARISGAGHVLAQGVNYLPHPGHHPCLPVSAAAVPPPPAPAAPSTGGEAEAAGDAAAYLDGKLWTFTGTAHAGPVAVFCPRAALRRAGIDVLLYVHGLLEPCRHRREHLPSEFITDQPFELGPIVNRSGRPIVLVVPLLRWDRPGGERVFGPGHEHWHALAAPPSLNALVAEVQAELGQVLGTEPPAVRELLIAGHSRAYDFLEPLARHRHDPAMHEGALAQLRRVWAFDTTYAGQPAQWADWLMLSPDLRIHMFYRPGTGTDRIGHEFGRLRGPRLAVTQVSEPHCHVPAMRLPALLSPPAAGAAEAEDSPPPAASPYTQASSAVLALKAASGAKATAAALAGLRSLDPPGMCRLGEDRDLVGALADHLSGDQLTQASAQLARGRLNSMGRPDLAAIIGAPFVHRLGTLAGAAGHDMLLAHQEAFDRTGTGTIHGNQCRIPRPSGAVSSDCTVYVLTALEQAFAAMGLTAEWRAVRRRALQASGRDGLKGTEVIRALQAEQAWTALFWAPDPRHPADGDSEHPSAYRNVRVNGTYSGISVDPVRSVINYRPKRTNRPPDLTGIERLRRLPCGLLGARGGTHMALIINGDVHEVHFETPATSRDAITATPLEQFAWLSGVIAAPPGDLDRAWQTP